MHKNTICKLFLVFAVAFLVTGCDTKLKSISIEGNSEVPIDGSAVLNIIKNPVKAKITNIEWKSSNEAIVKVDDGVLIGVNKGKATVTAKIDDNIKATKDITVYTPTKSIDIDKHELELSLNEEQMLSVIIDPEDGAYTWRSDNLSVATISPKGKVAAKSYGTAKIVAESKDGKEAVCVVTVSVTVQDFNSMSPAEAKKWGEDHKIAVYTGSDYSNSVARGKVINQNIKATTKIIERGTKIEIMYSIGHKPTMGELNALNAAKDYIRSSGFSVKGLKRQLEFEGYSSTEAQYAVDNCGVNWNEQAARSAKDYMRSSSFSQNGLISQLLFEGYTQSQAEYGVKAVGY